MNNSEMIEFLEDYSKSNTVIHGITDVVKIGEYFRLKDNSYWIILGNLSDDDIKDCLEEEEALVDREGQYEYKAVIRCIGRTWDEPAEIYIDYIEWKFIESFEARERNNKLEELFNINWL